GRRMLTKIAFIDAVKAPEITRIIEPDTAAHHMLEPVAGLGENGDDVLDGEVGFLDNAATHDLAILHRHLAGHMEPAAGFHRPREGQVLTARAGFFGTITLDRHSDILFRY